MRVNLLGQTKDLRPEKGAKVSRYHPSFARASRPRASAGTPGLPAVSYPGALTGAAPSARGGHPVAAYCSARRFGGKLRGHLGRHVSTPACTSGGTAHPGSLESDAAAYSSPSSPLADRECKAFPLPSNIANRCRGVKSGRDRAGAARHTQDRKSVV